MRAHGPRPSPPITSSLAPPLPSPSPPLVQLRARGPRRGRHGARAPRGGPGRRPHSSPLRLRPRHAPQAGHEGEAGPPASDEGKGPPLSHASPPPPLRRCTSLAAATLAWTTSSCCQTPCRCRSRCARRLCVCVRAAVAVSEPPPARVQDPEKRKAKRSLSAKETLLYEPMRPCCSPPHPLTTPPACLLAAGTRP